MTKDTDIELSSIDDHNNIKKNCPNKKNIKIIDKNEKNNILFGEKEKEFINGQKDSMMSILDVFK